MGGVYLTLEIMYVQVEERNVHFSKLVSVNDSNMETLVQNIFYFYENNY